MTQILQGSPASVLLAGIAAAVLIGLAVTLLLRKSLGIEEGPKVKKEDDGEKLDISGLVAFIQKIAPIDPDSEGKVAKSLRNSGTKMSPQAFWAIRCALLAMGAAVGLAVMVVVRGRFAPVIPVACAAAGYMAPQAWLLTKRDAWRDEIERQLPDALDLLDVCIGAGTSFDSGIRIVSEKTEGALGVALKDVVAAAQWSSTLAGLRQLADAAQVKPLTTFVSSAELAQKSGLPMSQVVKAQAEAVRVKRKQRIDEQIEKLPTKMIIPNYLLVVALVVAMIVPAVFGAMKNF